MCNDCQRSQSVLCIFRTVESSFLSVWHLKVVLERFILNTDQVCRTGLMLWGLNVSYLSLILGVAVYVGKNGDR